MAPAARVAGAFPYQKDEGMEISKDVVDLIYQLLPGFAAAWIFYGLTAHPKAAPFERVVQAIIFTVMVKAAMVPFKAVALYIGSSWRILGPWNDEVAFFNSAIIAVALGLIFARWANNNTLHELLRENKWYDWLRRRRILRWLPEWQWTSRTSWPSEWYAAFHKLKQNYVVLHLKDGRRLHAFPLLWPDQPDRGHFVLMNAEWLLSNGERGQLYNVENIIISATEVEMVEFIKQPDKRVASEAQLLAVQKLLIEENLKGESHGSNASPKAADTQAVDGGPKLLQPAGVEQSSTE